MADMEKKPEAKWVLKVLIRGISPGESFFKIYEGTRGELVEKFTDLFQAAEEVGSGSVSLALLKARDVPAALVEARPSDRLEVTR